MEEKLSGKLVSLRLLLPEDVDLYCKWIEDKEVIKYSLSKWQKSYTKIQMKNWLGDTIFNERSVDFGIIDKSTNNLIGHTGICNISKANNSGEYFILIGDKNCWGKGFGTEVTKLVIQYGFIKLNLHRIMLTVSDLNIGAVKIYTRAGFSEEGVMKDATFRNGTYHNKIIMSILNSE